MDDQIERYINGMMSKEELNLFLEKIAKDDTLKNTIDMYRTMNVIYNDNDWEITQKDKKKSYYRKTCILS